MARRGSPRTQKQLQNPPNLPNRADPKSSDAKILGPLSKRRGVNLRWRFFEEEVAKIQPPIEASRAHAVQVAGSLDNLTETGATKQAYAGDVELTPAPIGFQGSSILCDLESIASPNPNVPKHTANPSLPNPTHNIPPTPTVNRFIRRQHRKLLGKIPILTYFKHPNSPVGKYHVSLSPFGYSDSLTELASVVPMADEADLAWLRLPPPPRKPEIGPTSMPSQEPKVKVKPTID